MKRRRNESRDLAIANNRRIRRNRGVIFWTLKEIEAWLP